MDRLTPERRSWLMSRVKAKHTSPELIVRRKAHALGLRFRLHRKDLPGTPDLIFPKYSTVVFVHGCFWHRHPGCPKAGMPKSRVRFWKEKFARNVKRARRDERQLNDLGWSVGVIWECETKNLSTVERLLMQTTVEREDCATRSTESSSKEEKHS